MADWTKIQASASHSGLNCISGWIIHKTGCKSNNYVIYWAACYLIQMYHWSFLLGLVPKHDCDSLVLSRKKKYSLTFFLTNLEEITKLGKRISMSVKRCLSRTSLYKERKSEF